MLTYSTSDGDTLDLIVWRHYNTTAGSVVEYVLAQNPGLADKGPVLSAGTRINLPDIMLPEKTTGIRLWD